MSGIRKTRLGVSFRRWRGRPLCTISGELTLSLVAVVGIVSLVALAVNYVYLRHVSLVQMERKADEYVEYLANSLEYPVWNLDSQSVSQVSRSFFNSDMVALLRITEKNLNVMFSQRKKGENVFFTRERDIVHDGQSIGRVTLGATDQPYRATTRRLMWSSIISMFLLMLALGGLTGLLVRIYLRRPLDALMQGMDRLAQGDYDYSFKDVRHEEVAAIIERFDHMAAQVREREESLGEMNRVLEEEIAQHKRARERIADSERRLSKLIETANEGFIELDGTATIVDANPEMCAILGRNRETIVGKSFFTFVERRHLDELRRRMANRKSGERITYEIAFRTPDDMEVDCLVKSTPLRDKNGRFSGSFAMVTDITEMKQAQEQVRRLNAELEQRVAERTALLESVNKALHESLAELKEAQNQLVQSEKMAALGGLVAGVAHEINTPIGVALTASSFLEEKTDTLGRQRDSGEIRDGDLEKYMKTANEASSIILTNLRRAANLISSFKQVAVDQSSEDRRRFKLKEYIDEVLLSLHPSLKRTSHRITVDCPQDIEIDSYPGAFSQIITNLVMNSVVHGFEGMESGEIHMDVHTRDGDILFRYRDNGAGMEPETLRKMYDPFFSTRRTHGGSGLGMHIVYNLVTSTLGGQIECTSQPGAGTNFLITLPVDPERRGGKGRAD
ncbi:MAG: ATP-binding protein [Desulfatibacillaceae bacterium]